MTRELTLVVSSLRSDGNPTSAIGIARSARSWDSAVHIVGVSADARETGIHSSVLDDYLSVPRYSHSDPIELAHQIERLANGRPVFWIPSLEPEIILLKDTLPDGVQLLAPEVAFLDGIQGQRVVWAEGLGCRVPNLLEAGDHSPGQHWLKGRFFGASRVAAGRSPTRPQAGSYREEDIRDGLMWSISFAAFEGELLSAVSMRKVITGHQGKVWLGEVDDLDPEKIAALGELVRNSRFTGGAELEFVSGESAATGVLGDYLIDFNPRFPGWVYGATLGGRNLPGHLLAAASGRGHPSDRKGPHPFARLVEEVECVAPLPSAALQLGDPGASAGKSWDGDMGMRELEEHLLPSAAPAATDTPLRRPPRWGAPNIEFDMGVFRDNMRSVREILGPAQLLYPVKVLPDARLCTEAAKAGWSFSCSTPQELALLKSAGLGSEALTLNGPGGMWLDSHASRTCVVANSAAELRLLAQREDRATSNSTLGLRVGPSDSRFGIDVGRPEEVIPALSAVAELCASTAVPPMVAMHLASGTYSVGQRLRFLNAVIDLCDAAIGQGAYILNIGGGYDVRVLTMMAEVLTVRSISSACVAAEPGRLLFTGVISVQTEVVAVGRDGAPILGIDAQLAADRLAGRSFDIEGSMRDESALLPVYGRSCAEGDILGHAALAAVAVGASTVVRGISPYDLSIGPGLGSGKIIEAVLTYAG